MAPEELLSLNARLEELGRRLEQVEKRLDFLYSYFSLPYPDKSPPLRQLTTAQKTDEELIQWARKTSLLSKAAAICFLLVVAFVLRAVTENNLWNPRMGSWVGITYSGLLIIASLFSYRKRSPLALVLNICGTIFSYSIVLESHERLKTISTFEAFLLIAGTGVVSGMVARSFSARAPGALGVVGMSLTGALLGQPNPVWPLSMGLLFLAFAMSSIEPLATVPSWTRWVVTALVFFFLTAWSGKVVFALRTGGESQGWSLSSSSFLYATALFVFLCSLLSLVRELKWKGAKPSRVESFLPASSGALGYFLAREVVSFEPQGLFPLGLIATLWGASHLLVSWSLTRIGAQRTVASFSASGVSLTAMGLPEVLGGLPQSLVPVSALGVLHLALARMWSNGPLRVTSHLIQTYASFACGLWLWLAGTTIPSQVYLLIALFVFLMGSIHYFLSRVQISLWPSWKGLWKQDPKDYLALLPLTSSMFCGFVTLNLVCHILLGPFLVRTEGVWASVQTAILSFFVISLGLYGYWRQVQEIRNLAILLGVFLALKVVFIDLLQGRGLALVISFFWLGMAALVQSFVLARWKRQSSFQRTGNLS